MFTKTFSFSVPGRDPFAIVHALARLPGFVAKVARVQRERRALAALDDRMLKDIGLSRSMAAHESARSLFDLPSDQGRKAAPVRRFSSRRLG